MINCATLCHAAAQTAVSKENRQDIAVTVYNNNYGLIRESREVNLKTGIVELEFQDVAERIDATSVAVVSKTDSSKLRILEQNYRYDLLNRQTLLNRYIGRELDFIRTSDNADFREVRSGKLISNQGDVIVAFADSIEINPPGTIAFHDLPNELMAKPTLVWTLENRNRGNQVIEASYLTNGMSWHADYVAILNEGDDGLDITAWVTLENRSGASYDNALLKVVAGDVKRVSTDHAPQVMAMRERGAQVMNESMQGEAFFEYHLYSLDRKTDLLNNETKQVSLLARDNVVVSKHLEISSLAQVYRVDRSNQKSNARVTLRMENSRDNNMGVALPAGRVRVYKADSSGALQLVGEERIKHTARNERVDLELGESFDVVAERKQTAFRKRGERETELSYEIEVRNQKEVGQRVMVTEHISGDWVITAETQPHRQVDAGSIEYDLVLAPEESKTISYSVRVTW
jgi:hypothetical protein